MDQTQAKGETMKSTYTTIDEYIATFPAYGIDLLWKM
jgi:hypothetical protein